MADAYGDKAANELVLHFNDYDEMGRSNDAELISLADISGVRLIEGGVSAVSHVFQHVPGLFYLLGSLLSADTPSKPIRESCFAALAFATRAPKVLLLLPSRL